MGSATQSEQGVKGGGGEIAAKMNFTRQRRSNCYKENFVSKRPVAMAMIGVSIVGYI